MIHNTIEKAAQLSIPQKQSVDNGHVQQETTNPYKVIRKYCLGCCCNQPSEVRLCTAIDCSLYPYRFGSNPFRKLRKLSDDHKQALLKRLGGCR